MRVARYLISLLFALLLALCSLLFGCTSYPFTAAKNTFSIRTPFGSLTDTLTIFDNPQVTPKISPPAGDLFPDLATTAASPPARTEEN